MAWHWVDYIILGVIGLSIITGLFRGFIKELIALIVWGLAIWLAYAYSSTVNLYLVPYIHDEHVRLAVSFIAILIATLIAGALVNALLSFILTRSGLSGTDRLLGMGFGFIRGVFIVALIMLIVRITGIPQESYSSQSRLYAKFNPVVEWMYAYVPGFIGQMKQLESPHLSDDKEKGEHSDLALEQDEKLVMAFDETEHQVIST